MGTAEMRALCDEIVAGTLSPEDATALVEENATSRGWARSTDSRRR
jgi:hypothetical protein